MKRILFSLILLFSFLNFKSNIYANYSVKDLNLCAEQVPLDTRFSSYINKGKLQAHPTCQKQLNIYDWTECQGKKEQIGVKIDGEINDKETVDLFFDTVFDHCKTPLLFKEIAPRSSDPYFTALLSMTTFFYIKGTRFINIGNIDNMNEFRKKLILAYLDFITNYPIIKYPILHPSNGDPWLKFQQGKYTNPPDVVGIIGESFATFANISLKNHNFSFNELSSLTNGFLYSNKKSSSTIFTSNNLSLEEGEVIFITKTTISSPPNISPITSPTPTNIPSPTISLQSPTLTLTPQVITPFTPTDAPRIPTFFINNILTNTLEGGETAKKISFDLYLYLILSVVYIMILHFAVGIKNFNIFLMSGYFIFGGIIGFFFHSYETGLAIAIILSLIFF